MSFAPRFSRRAGYGLAVLAVAATTALLAGVQPFLDPPINALIYPLAVGVGAAIGGLGPGIVTAVAVSSESASPARTVVRVWTVPSASGKSP